MAEVAANPYDWQAHQPKTAIPRSAVEPIAEKLRRGKSAVLLAGRGMGKSVFLRQLAAWLERRDDVAVRLIASPPARLTTEAFLRALSRELEVEVDDPLSAHELIRAYFDRRDRPPRLVLLYDELDRYARPAHRMLEPAPGREFFNNLESMRRDTPQVGILAAGSLGVFAFRDVLGSSFLARAQSVRIRPFAAEEIGLVARPFADRGSSLADETLHTLELMSGGNPALATYGLESLWSLTAPDSHDVADAFARFQHEHSEFLRDFRLSFSDSTFSDAPQRMWEILQVAPEPLARSELEKALDPAGGVLRLSVADVLDLLQSVGLVRVAGSLHADPVMVRPIASILGLPPASTSAPRLAERLGNDLESLLRRVHAAGADFFRPGSSRAGEEGKRLVPESVFAAYLALGFQLLGWDVEREALRGAGRTDLRLRWNGGDEVAVVEVKIWGRPGAREAQAQLLKYWSAEAVAGAVVMLTDAELTDWPQTYRQQCLEGRAAELRTILPDGPVRARFACRTTTADGMQAHVEHFLLRVPR